MVEVVLERGTCCLGVKKKSEGWGVPNRGLSISKGMEEGQGSPSKALVLGAGVRILAMVTEAGHKAGSTKGALKAAPRNLATPRQ